MWILYILSWLILGIGSAYFVEFYYDKNNITVENLVQNGLFGLFGPITTIIAILYICKKSYEKHSDKIVMKNPFQKD